MTQQQPNNSAPPYAARDYSLTGPEASSAHEKGLVSAVWYQCAVPRKRLKALMQRRNGPAVRDTALWLLALVLSGYGGYYFWGGAACVPFFIVYGVLYGTAANSRWHETGHGTAFKTRWLNDAVYQLACFMVMYEPDVWRWSHARHHTDTIVVGRDPEIVEPRPPSLIKIALSFMSLPHGFNVLKSLFVHTGGTLSAAEENFIPPSEWPKVYRAARIWLVLYALVIGVAIYQHSWLPLMFVFLPTFYGGWLSYLFGLTQHVGLAEDELDHRKNCRTIYMNPLFRFIYSNMNYHLEHHMFPMVPYHALAQLHAEIRDDCPPPYSSIVEAYREIIPTLLKQRKDPSYYVQRPVVTVPEPASDKARATTVYS
jgi:fatty acid desaturase